MTKVWIPGALTLVFAGAPAAFAGDGGGDGPGVLFAWSSGVEDDQFGHSVAGAGDVDGDGVPDVVVGTPESYLFGASGPGRATVYSGASGALLHEFQGLALGDAFGVAVAGVGDVNADGHADVAIGATPPLALFGPGGRVVVRSGDDGSLLHEFTGLAAGDGFGRALAGAGDVNQDGVPDVIVGAPYTALGLSTSVGRVAVFSGATGGVLLSKYGEPSPGLLQVGDQLGVSVDAAGDVDADGYDDVLAGTTNAFFFTQGEGNLFHVLSGQTGGTLYTFHGDSPLDALGATVSGAGDLDADGTPDFLAGAPTDSDLGFARGSARTFSGADGSILHVLPGPAGGSAYGSAVRGLGDVDADGHDDFVVSGLPPFDSSGALAGSVLSGATGLPLAGFVRSVEGLGARIAAGAPGDVDQDGHADLLIGVPALDGVGRVELIAPHALAGTPIPSSSFAPGDVLTGSLTGKKEQDEGRLLAAPSTKLVLQVEVIEGSLAPIVSVHTVSDGQVGKAIAQWTATGAKPLKKKLKKAGEYAIRVRAKGKTTGSWRITTSAELPAAALPRTTVEPVKKVDVEPEGSVWGAEATFTGFAGGRLDVVVTPHAAFAPEVAIVAPSGAIVPEGMFTVVADGAVRTITDAPLTETGSYRVVVLGGTKGDDVTFELAPALPPGGLLLELD